MTMNARANCALSAACASLLLFLGACDSGTATSADDDSNADEDTVIDAGKARDAGVTQTTARIDATTGRIIPTGSSDPTCKPGAYRGDFTCAVDGVYPWTGQIAFSLVAMRVDGADISFLEIQAGTRLDGHDTMNGTFGGDLAGMFDCATGELTGTLANGFYNGNFGFMIQLAGGLSGQYGAGDGGSPGFTGVMGPLTNPQWGAVSPSAMCTWSAARVGDPTPNDAGTR